MEYILFSPIGTTDPITNCHDGAMLHIIRNYKPKKVWLYMSKEMLHFHEKDNRYIFCIEKLKQEESIDIETEIIERKDLVNVQYFDDFYKDFESELDKISKAEPERQILLNVSSGTPAMKAALYTIAALSEGKYIAVQVSTPEKKSNPKRDDINKYDVETEWECNIDRIKEEYIDRTEVAQHINFVSKIKHEIIFRHLDSYDYNAAAVIAGEIADFPDEAFKLIKAASCRLQLDRSGVSLALKGVNADIYPIKEGDKSGVFEFMLWLQIKNKRRDFADFMRGITPVVMDLFEMILKFSCGIDIKNNYCIRNNKNNTYKLSSQKLQGDETGRCILEYIEEEFRGELRDTVLTSAQLAPVIVGFKANDNQLVKSVQIIRNCESAARNLAAHEIVSVTDEWIQKQCGISSGGIMKELKKLCQYAGLKAKEEDWNSYEIMNDMIKQKMAHQYDK